MRNPAPRQSPARSMSMNNAQCYGECSCSLTMELLLWNSTAIVGVGENLWFSGKDVFGFVRTLTEAELLPSLPIMARTKKAEKARKALSKPSSSTGGHKPASSRLHAPLLERRGALVLVVAVSDQKLEALLSDPRCEGLSKVQQCHITLIAVRSTQCHQLLCCSNHSDLGFTDMMHCS